MTGRADSPVWGSSVYVKPLTPSQRAWLASDATAPTRPTRPRRAAPPRKPPRAAPTRRVDAAPQVNASTVATPRMRDAEQRRTVTDALRAVPHRLPADAPRFDVERLAADANALGDYTHGSHRIRIRFQPLPVGGALHHPGDDLGRVGHYVDYAILRRGTARTPGGIGDDHATVMRPPPRLRDGARDPHRPAARPVPHLLRERRRAVRPRLRAVGRTRSGAEGYARYRAWALTSATPRAIPPASACGATTSSTTSRRRSTPCSATGVVTRSPKRPRTTCGASATPRRSTTPRLSSSASGSTLPTPARSRGTSATEAANDVK